MDSKDIRESLDGKAIAIGALVGLAVGFVGLAMGGVFAFFGAVTGGATAAGLSDPPFRTRVLNALAADLASSALVYLLALSVFLLPAVLTGGIVSAPFGFLLIAGVVLVVAIPIAIVSAVIATVAGAAVARFRSRSGPTVDAR